MTYHDCAAKAWKELGWSDEKIKEQIAIRDKNAAVFVPIMKKQVPEEEIPRMVEFFKMLAKEIG